MNSLSRSALAAYRRVDAYGSVESADAHRLVALLYEGLAEALTAASGAIERGDGAGKAHAVRRAAGILDALRSSLDAERGGDVAANLERLYDYMGRELTLANLRDQAGRLRAVAELNETLREGWSAIPPEARRGTLAA